MNSFINQSLIFIASALVLVPLFQYLGFGSVLGYLFAGMLIGLDSLGLVAHNSEIIHVSELGVVLLLFMIGLEIQPSTLKSMRNAILTIGVVQVVSCSLVFTLIGLAFGLSLSVAGTIGFALSLSSTAFAIQTLGENNQLKTVFGRSSLATLLTQDILAIPALAIIPTFAAKTSGSEMTLWTIAAFVAIVGMLVLIGRFVMNPVFRLTASIHNREVFMALTLFIVFGVAALMLQIGLSAALGTFIAGVLLAESHYRHELEANLEPFKSIFMGLFFIGVGMHVNLDLLIQKPLLMLGLTLFYLCIKGGLIYLIGRINQLGHENSKLMGLNLAQGGEFAFVIFALATFIPSDTLDQLTVIITLSIALNPLMILFNNQLNLRLQKQETEKKYDEMPDETPQVVIAGFGRFGQAFGRILKQQNIPYVAMDHDPDQIEMVGKFGNKVYYADITRLELLEAAGVGKAKYFVLAIDDVEQSLKTVTVLKSHFPHVKIFARARNRSHVFALIDLGVTMIKREMFDSSVAFTGELLRDMGLEAERVKTLLEKFIEHDEILLQEQYKTRTDQDYVSASNQGQAQLEELLTKEANASYIQLKT